MIRRPLLVVDPRREAGVAVAVDDQVARRHQLQVRSRVMPSHGPPDAVHARRCAWRAVASGSSPSVTHTNGTEPVPGARNDACDSPRRAAARAEGRAGSSRLPHQHASPIANAATSSADGSRSAPAGVRRTVTASDWSGSVPSSSRSAARAACASAIGSGRGTAWPMNVSAAGSPSEATYPGRASHGSAAPPAISHHRGSRSSASAASSPCSSVARRYHAPHHCELQDVHRLERIVTARLQHPAGIARDREDRIGRRRRAYDERAERVTQQRRAEVIGVVRDAMRIGVRIELDDHEPCADPPQLAQRRGAIAHVADRRQADRDVDAAITQRDRLAACPHGGPRTRGSARARSPGAPGGGQPPARRTSPGPTRRRADGVRRRARARVDHQAVVEVAKRRPFRRGIAPRARTLERVRGTGPGRATPPEHSANAHTGAVGAVIRCVA